MKKMTTEDYLAQGERTIIEAHGEQEIYKNLINIADFYRQTYKDMMNVYGGEVPECAKKVTRKLLEKLIRIERAMEDYMLVSFQKRKEQMAKARVLYEKAEKATKNRVELELCAYAVLNHIESTDWKYSSNGSISYSNPLEAIEADHKEITDLLKSEEKSLMMHYREKQPKNYGNYQNL